MVDELSCIINYNGILPCMSVLRIRLYEIRVLYMYIIYIVYDYGINFLPSSTHPPIEKITNPCPETENHIDKQVSLESLTRFSCSTNTKPTKQLWLYVKMLHQ